MESYRIGCLRITYPADYISSNPQELILAGDASIKLRGVPHGKMFVYYFYSIQRIIRKRNKGVPAMGLFRAIGDLFVTTDDKTYEVAPAENAGNCRGCAAEMPCGCVSSEIREAGGCCTEGSRLDNTAVVFREVEK